MDIASLEDAFITVVSKMIVTGAKVAAGVAVGVAVARLMGVDL